MRRRHYSKSSNRSENRPLIHLDIPGWYRGRDGVFEFIKNNQVQITHRFFNTNR